jgi:Zn-dependent metalloprotease
MTQTFVNFFTPPYLLENILANGVPEQRKRALSALKMAGQMRGRRQAVINIDMPFERERSKKNRLIYSAMNKPGLPGKLIRSEGGDPSGDKAVDEAYEGAGATYDLFSRFFGRDSVDGRGMKYYPPCIILTDMTMLSGTGSRWYMEMEMMIFLRKTGSSTDSQVLLI